MAFRKCLIAFALIALVLSVPTFAASVTTRTCTVTSGGINPVNIEGLTEKVGPIKVSCDADFNGPVSLIVNFGSNITTALNADGTSQAVLTTLGGTPLAAATYSAAYSSSTPTQVSFNIAGPLGLVVDPAPATTFSFYITGLIIDASKYTVGSNISATVYMQGGTTPVAGVVSGGVATPIIAIAYKGVGAATVQDPNKNKDGFVYSVSQCATGSGKKDGDAYAAATDAIKANLQVVIPEGYASAWSPWATAGVLPPGTAATILVTFANVPTGVTVLVPGAIAGTGATAVLAVGAPATGVTNAGLTLGDPTKLYALTATSGTATATYAISAVTPAADSLTVPVFLSWAAGTSSTTAAANPATVKAEFGPVVPTQNVAVKGAQTARYVATTNTPASLLTVDPCGCNILFPFVSSASPFDTGVAISNTSSDPFSTAATAGDVTFNFYGPSAPAAKTITGVAAGQQAVFSMSSVATGFTGYVIAQAKFQFCSGFAMIMPVGAVGNVASSGYLGIPLASGRGGLNYAAQ